MVGAISFWGYTQIVFKNSDSSLNFHQLFQFLQAVAWLPTYPEWLLRKLYIETSITAEFDYTWLLSWLVILIPFPSSEVDMAMMVWITVKVRWQSWSVLISCEPHGKILHYKKVVNVWKDLFHTRSRIISCNWIVEFLTRLGRILCITAKIERWKRLECSVPAFAGGRWCTNHFFWNGQISVSGVGSLSPATPHWLIPNDRQRITN